MWFHDSNVLHSVVYFLTQLFHLLQLFRNSTWNDSVHEMFIITCERIILKLNRLMNILFESRGIYEEFISIFHFWDIDNEQFIYFWEEFWFRYSFFSRFSISNDQFSIAKRILQYLIINLMLLYKQFFVWHIYRIDNFSIFAKIN